MPPRQGTPVTQRQELRRLNLTLCSHSVHRNHVSSRVRSTTLETWRDLWLRSSATQMENKLAQATTSNNKQHQATSTKSTAVAVDFGSSDFSGPAAQVGKSTKWQIWEALKIENMQKTASRNDVFEDPESQLVTYMVGLMSSICGGAF